LNNVCLRSLAITSDFFFKLRLMVLYSTKLNATQAINVLTPIILSSPSCCAVRNAQFDGGKEDQPNYPAVCMAALLSVLFSVPFSKLSCPFFFCPVLIDLSVFGM
jgi:hypothetical protein